MRDASLKRVPGESTAAPTRGVSAAEVTAAPGSLPRRPGRGGSPKAVPGNADAAISCWGARASPHAPRSAGGTC